MPVLLRLDASARQEGSVSRQLGDHLENRLRLAKPDLRILRRDLASLPHITEATIAGYYTPTDQMTDALRTATALSDELIGELRSADYLLLTVPMYNFSIPSALKAWIDQIVRIGHTFRYDGQNFDGLVTGKQVFVTCAYGAAGYGPGQGFSAANFVEPYLRFLLTFLGMADTHFFSAEMAATGGDALASQIEAAKAAIDTALPA